LYDIEEEVEEVEERAMPVTLAAENFREQKM